MKEYWRKQKLPDKLYAKGLLYQFVHELTSQLDAQNAAEKGYALVDQAIRYMQENFAKPISVDNLAGRLGCSASYLTRLFKKQAGTTPNDYLIQIRIDYAKRALLETDATLQEIAVSIGYSDAYYFSRMFKKQTGAAPSRFRCRQTMPDRVQNSPWDRPENGIVPSIPPRYNVDDNDYHLWEGSYLSMHKEVKLPVAAAVLLSMSLLIGGCAGSSGPYESPIAAGSPAAGESRVSTQQPGTKVVQHLMGESEIPGKPQRIAVTGLEDIMLALDVPMVQAQSMAGHYLYETLQEKNIPVIYTPDGLNYEAILDAQPDLIVANLLASDTESYNSLSKIAPTIVQDRGDWKTSIVAIGKAIDREEQANAVIQTYAEKLQQAKASIVQAVGADNSVVFIRPSSKDAQIFFPGFAYTSIIYNELGLTPDSTLSHLEEQNKKGAWGTTVSLEILPELTADHLFVTLGGLMIWRKIIKTH